MKEMLAQEKIEALRALYECGTTKHKAAKLTGVAEATVYRYYAKWEALTSLTAFDLIDLQPKVLLHFQKQARMRRLTVYQLVSHILHTISTDNLFDAICNIAVTNPAKGRLNETDENRTEP